MRFNGGSIPYSPIGLEGWPKFGFEKNDRWQFSNDLTWVKGRHTLKTGFEFRHHNFPIRGWAAGATAGNFTFNRLGTGGFDASGNNLVATGDPFASFLLGQVHDSNQNIPVFPTFRETYTGLWVNDEFKVNNSLTMTFGLRWDYESARTETTDQYSTFSPTAPNPAAGGIPGAMIFAGSGPGRTGQRKFEDVPKDAFGPRVGFAYKLNEKQALRGGYGIYYAHVAFAAGRSTHAGLRVGSVRPERDEWIGSSVPPGPGIPAGSGPVPAADRPGHQPWRIPGRRGAEWPHAATVPELVCDVSAPSHRRHDAQSLVHRQSWQPAEPPRLDAGR